VRGTKPKSTRTKRLEGNPGKRKLNDREPELPGLGDAFDRPPRELAGDRLACAEWRALVPLLRKARQVTSADRQSLIALCQQWSRYLKAERELRRRGRNRGLVIKTPNGYPVLSPWLAVTNKALAHCAKLWAELGLTPSSRSRVYAEVPPGGDDFSEFDDAPAPASSAPPMVPPGGGKPH